jgi:hypothetical protein
MLGIGLCSYCIYEIAKGCVFKEPPTRSRTDTNSTKIMINLENEEIMRNIFNNAGLRHKASLEKSENELISQNSMRRMLRVCPTLPDIGESKEILYENGEHKSTTSSYWSLGMPNKITEVLDEKRNPRKKSKSESDCFNTDIEIGVKRLSS